MRERSGGSWPRPAAAGAGERLGRGQGAGGNSATLPLRVRTEYGHSIRSPITVAAIDGNAASNSRIRGSNASATAVPFQSSRVLPRQCGPILLPRRCHEDQKDLTGCYAPANLNTRRNLIGTRLRYATVTLTCTAALGIYVEFRDLKYFEALASELNFGRAANTLHLTQPALSLAVARLERQVGCALFERTRQGVSLTAAGSVLLAETRGLHFTMERARTLARRASEGDLGSLTIGFLDSAVFDVLPSALSAFQALHPGIDLMLHQRSSSELIALVEREDWTRPSSGLTLRVPTSR